MPHREKCSVSENAESKLEPAVEMNKLWQTLATSERRNEEERSAEKMAAETNVQVFKLPDTPGGQTAQNPSQESPGHPADRTSTPTADGGDPIGHTGPVKEIQSEERKTGVITVNTEQARTNQERDTTAMDQDGATDTGVASTSGQDDTSGYTAEGERMEDLDMTGETVVTLMTNKDGSFHYRVVYESAHPDNRTGQGTTGIRTRPSSPRSQDEQPAGEDAHTNLTHLVNTMGRTASPTSGPMPDGGHDREGERGAAGSGEDPPEREGSITEALDYFGQDDEVFRPAETNEVGTTNEHGLPAWMFDRELLKADRDAQDAHYQATDPASPVSEDNPNRPALDLLDRVLIHMYDEEDCLRAETSRVLDDEEVHELLKSRKAELSLECGGPINIVEPDVTSTPRVDRSRDQTEGEEVLRGETMHEPSTLHGDVDEEMPEATDGGGDHWPRQGSTQLRRTAAGRGRNRRTGQQPTTIDRRNHHDPGPSSRNWRRAGWTNFLDTERQIQG